MNSPKNIPVACKNGCWNFSPIPMLFLEIETFCHLRKKKLKRIFKKNDDAFFLTSKQWCWLCRWPPWGLPKWGGIWSTASGKRSRNCHGSGWTGKSHSSIYRKNFVLLSVKCWSENEGWEATPRRAGRSRARARRLHRVKWRFLENNLAKTE